MSNGAVEAHEVTDLVTQLHQLAARFDPAAIPSEDVKPMVADLGQAKRLIDGMLTLLAHRTIDPAKGRTAARQAREELAKATGTTTADAKKLLDTSEKLRDLEPVADAVRDGKLSRAQAAMISDAAAADEDAIPALLDAARKQTTNDLKKTCRDTKTAADPDPAATRRRHHNQRTFRAWQEADGEWKAFISAPADTGARIEAAIRSQHDIIFKAAHAEGRRESDGAYRLDALVATLEQGIAEGSSGRQNTGRQTKVIIRVDAEAMRRGTANPDETCDIAGVGRVSVAAIRKLIPAAHLAYVIRNAKNVAVAHLGRTVTAHQRTAMEARGYECEVPDCRSSHLLEIDHVHDWAISRQTRLDQLAWLCQRHHRDKTDGRYRLTGPPGTRRWQPVRKPPDAAVTFGGRHYLIAQPPRAATRPCPTRRRRLERAGWQSAAARS